MSESNLPQTRDPEFPADTVPERSGRTLVHVVYALQAVALFTALPLFLGVVVNYLTRARVSDSWLDSHYRWQIRTFWYSLLWTVIGTLTVLILVGYAVLGLAYLWLIYRIARGWITLARGEVMYASDRVVSAAGEG